jgi:hypothetical protein
MATAEAVAMATMGGVEAGFRQWMGRKTLSASRGMPFGMRLWEEYITVYNFSLYLW